MVPFEQVFEQETSFRLEEAPDDPIGEPMDLVKWGDRLALVDLLQANVKVYDRQGGLVQTLGRAGGGPGEFRAPISATELHDGRLAVLDDRQSRVSFFAPAGEYLGGWRAPVSFTSGLRSIRGGRGLVLSGRIFVEDSIGNQEWPPGEEVVHIYDLAGNRLRSLWRVPIEKDPTMNTLDGFRTAAVGGWILGGRRISNDLYAHELDTGREELLAAGAPIYQPPEWPWDGFPRGALGRLSDGNDRQMWTSTIIPLRDSLYGIRFTRYDAARDERVSQYAIQSLDGSSLLTTQPTPSSLQFLDGDTAYAFVRQDDGGVLVERFRFRPDAVMRLSRADPAGARRRLRTLKGG